MENAQRKDSRYLKNFFKYAIIVGIAMIFALEWGPGSKGCETPWRGGAAEAAATVNGKAISIVDFNRRYTEQLRYQVQWFEAQHQTIPESLIRQFVQPKQVLDYMVDSELLLQAAKNRGVAPSNEEIREIIHKRPDFQKDGKFDFQRYRQVLRDYYHKNEISFENELERDLAVAKLRELVGSLATLSDEELKVRFLREGNKAQVTYARFLPSMYLGSLPAPKPDALTAFEKAHEKEIADDYEANRYLYHQAERVHARQILARFDANAPADKKAQAKEKIETARKEIDGGKEFGEVAKEYSEDLGTKDRGGDLGFNERSAFPPEVATVAFELKPGELSQPIEGRSGYYLIKVEALKPAENKELKDVQHEIAQRLFKKEKAAHAARAEAEKALNQVKAGKKLSDLFPADKSEVKPRNSFETESKPKATDTGEFNSSADSIPKLGQAPDLFIDVFKEQNPGVLSKVYPVGDGFVVAVITQREKATEDQFASKRDELKSTALRAKQNQLREEYPKSLEKGASVSRNEQAIARLNAS